MEYIYNMKILLLGLLNIYCKLSTKGLYLLMTANYPLHTIWFYLHFFFLEYIDLFKKDIDKYLNFKAIIYKGFLS